MKRILLISSLLILAGIGLFFGIRLLFCAETPEQIIRRRMEELLEITEKRNGEESITDQISCARRGSLYFTESLTLQIPGFREAVLTRTQIRQNLLTFRRLLRNLELSIRDMKVTVNEDGTSGQINGTLILDGRGSAGRFHEVQELDIMTVRTEEGWQIARISSRNILQK